MRVRNFKLLSVLAERGLRQRDLVNLAEVSSNSRLSRIINYRSDPSPSEIENICKALKLTPKDLGLEENHFFIG